MKNAKTKFPIAKTLLALGVISSTCAGLISPTAFADSEEVTQEQAEQNFTSCLVASYNNTHETELESLTDAQMGDIENIYCFAESNYYFHDLDKLTGLKSIEISGSFYNNSLDFSNNSNLEVVILGQFNPSRTTNVSSITFPNNPKIRSLEFESKVSTLDLSRLTLLEEAAIYGSNKVILPESNNLKEIWSDANEIDVSKNPELLKLCLFGDNLQTIDISHNLKLEELIVQGTKISSIDLSKNTALKKAHLTSNELLTKLDVSSNQNLEFLAISGDNIEELDLSKNSKLAQFVAEDGGLKSVKFYDNGSSLQYVYLSGNDIETLDLSKASTDIELDISEEEHITIVAVPKSWKDEYTEEEIRERLGLDEDQKVTIQYGTLKVPKTGVAISEMAKYAAIVVLPTILMLAAISKNFAKARSKRVRFSR